jgi:hypothetical protein
MGAELKVRVGINHAGFATGLKTMEGMVSGFATKAGAALGAAIGVHALFETAKGGIELADRLDDLSKRFDISATKLQMLGNVAALSGAGLEEVAGSLKFLGKNAQDAASGGSAELLDIFKNLGLSVDDLRTLKPDEIFLRLVESFHSGTYAGQELLVLSKLLGRGFEQLAPMIRMSRDELEKAGMSMGTFASDDDVRRLAEVADFMDKLGNLSKVLGGKASLWFVDSIKEFLSSGDPGSVMEKLKQMAFPEGQSPRKKAQDDTRQLAIREAADKAFAESEKLAAKHELKLIEAQILGKEEAEKMKQAIEEKYAQRSLDRAIEMANRKAELMPQIEDLQAQRQGSGAEMKLLEERAAAASAQARISGGAEDVFNAQKLALELQKSKEQTLKDRGFGDESFSRAKAATEQIVGAIPQASQLRDIPTSTEAKPIQPVKLENPPDLKGIMDKLDMLIKNAGVFS